MMRSCGPVLLSIVICIFLNASVTECLSAWPHKTIMRKVATLSTAFLLSGSTMVSADNARTVGEITTSGIVFKDTLKITAFKDPKIEGVTIYLADFERPINEKLQKNFFEDPTSTSLSCARDTTIKVGDINKDPQGEEVFEVNRSLFFKQIRVRRVFDKVANNIIYTSFSTRLDKGADANNGRYKSSMCAIHINL